MLENLERINWQQLGYHVYGEHERIPDWIRALLSPDAETREQARDFLLGAQQDFGDIYDTTPHLVPFIIELLANGDTPGKAELLAHLGGVAENIYSYTHSSGSLLGSIHQMRLVLNTYQAFSQGRQIFIRLLNSDDATLRCASAELMQYLTADVGELLPPLMEQFAREKDIAVSVSLMKCLKTLFASIDWRHSELYEPHTPYYPRGAYITP